MLAIARLRLAQDAVEAAESLTDQILLRSPGSWEGHLLKAKVLLARGEPGLAQEERGSAGLCRPERRCRARRPGRSPSAAVACRRRCLPTAAHQLASTLHEAGFLYGRALLLLGRPQEAVTELQRGDARPRRRSRPRSCALGQALYERGNFEEARRQLQRAVALDPGSPPRPLLARPLRTRASSCTPRPRSASAGRCGGAARRPCGCRTRTFWLARRLRGPRRRGRQPDGLRGFLRLAAATAPGRREAERALARLARAP